MGHERYIDTAGKIAAGGWGKEFKSEEDAPNLSAPPKGTSARKEYDKWMRKKTR